MPKTKEAEMLVATQDGSVDIDGTPYVVKRDRTRVRADHPLAKAAPGLFAPITTHYPELEQATAAPGEQRGDQ